MKKTTLNISMVAALCVFCAAGTNAFGAGSVRALGGAGTYNGTTAATASSTATRAAGAMRAGSLRVSPSTSRSVSATTQAVNTTGTAGNAQRLSIGKYLGGPTSISTTGGSASAVTVNDITEVKNNITAINENTRIIENEIKELQDGKQDKLSAGDYITISNNGTVDIDLNELKNYMENNLNLSGDIEIAYESDTLKWSNNGGSTWTTLFTRDDIVGDYSSITELETKINTLTTNVTNLATDVSNLTTDVTNLTTEVAANTTNITNLQTTVEEHTAILERTPDVDAPTEGQYVWGYINGVGQYIKVVDASGN